MYSLVYAASSFLKTLRESHLKKIESHFPTDCGYLLMVTFPSSMIYLQLAAANYNPSFTALSIPRGSSINHQNSHSEPIMCKTVLTVCKENREYTRGTRGCCYLNPLKKRVNSHTLTYLVCNSDFSSIRFLPKRYLCVLSRLSKLP